MRRVVREELEMLTIIFLVVFGVIVVGFMIWVMAFGGKKRMKQGQGAELQTPKQGRASGLD